METRDRKDEIVFVHSGARTPTPQDDKCADDCVGGTASTENMQATY